MTALVGIVNLTTDSFSDGGRYLDRDAAIAHGERLLEDGATWLDLGAESSNPDGAPVPDDEQIARLAPVLDHFARAGVNLAVDTHRPAVMAAALAHGARMINDISALADPAAVTLLARHQVPVVIMHARNRGVRADRRPQPHVGIVDEIAGFFRARVAALASAGIETHRLILDPGMGFFLGANPEPSLAALAGLSHLATLVNRPLYVSCSRKSFVGHVTGRPPAERGAGTLGAELWALRAGVSYLRTHDVRAVADAWRVWQAIESVGRGGAAAS
ncbi:MAG TPA: dihydropteroate synthase [Polyangia bacterium]